MKFQYITLLIILLAIPGCKSVKNDNANSAKGEPDTKLLQTWHQKDFKQDNIPGISLDKWYNENKGKSKTSIIVAVLDTQIDSNHDDLKNQLWTNPKEIANNQIDDDANGYIDDVHGWNFTSNKKEEYVVWGNFEYVRYIREFAPLFKDKKENEITTEDLPKYKEYKRAVELFEKENTGYGRWLSSLDHSITMFPIVKDTLKHYFPKEDYTYKQLDSLYKKHKSNDKTYRQMRESNDKDLGALIYYMMVNIRNNESTLEILQDSRTEIDSILNRNLNINFNDRKIIGDHPNVLEKGYGSPNISITKKGFKNLQGHGTKIAGIIGADRKNNQGIKGFSNNIKIMPLNISYSGDENDKDIAMAIYYAVDNGAKVINMSFGKEFSVHQEWVSAAFKYAEKHNVILVHGSGNEQFDNDQTPYYPSDNSYDGSPEICNNFINVGSVSKRLDSSFASAFSNYGKQNVDLFAPGEEIYTTAKNNEYGSDSGTSLAAPMVSGTAALIWSYFPNLSAREVKQILLDSGSSYTFEVVVPGTKDKKVPFSELSKSGKVLNVYQAMKLAEKISKNNNASL